MALKKVLISTDGSDTWQPLPDGAQIRFEMTEGHIDVLHDLDCKDELLVIGSARGQFSINPNSTNSFSVRHEKARV